MLLVWVVEDGVLLLFTTRATCKDGPLDQSSGFIDFLKVSRIDIKRSLVKAPSLLRKSRHPAEPRAPSLSGLLQTFVDLQIRIGLLDLGALCWSMVRFCLKKKNF